jgi:hypothetical protein
MPDIINEYQKWKQQGEDLRVQAKHAMESRFRDLLTEAVHLAEEYRTDFGAVLKPPPAVTAFRYKASARPKARKPAEKVKPAAAAKPAAPKPEPPAAKPNPKVAALQKRLATAKKKLDDAKAGGATTRPYEDKVYEIEDELRLALQA